MPAEPDHDGLSDEQLLLRYRTAKDQAAFAMLVRRHYQLVLGVCQQALGHRQDAEDAFQATFVVLAKDARRIRKPNALPNWLYGVAYRISMQVRRQRARNRTLAIQDQTVDPTALNPLDYLTRRYQQGVAYDELARLPDRLRTPMILRYLSGKSNQEIAQQLKLTEAAVEGRLKRAKAKLRIRLTAHGVTLAVALSMLQVESASADATVLLETTIDQCLTIQSPTEPVSAEAAEIVQLAHQEMIAMMTTNAVRIGMYGAVGVCAAALALAVHPFTASSWASDPLGSTDTVQVQSLFGEAGSTADPNAEVRVVVADDDPFSAGPQSTGPAADPFADAGQDPFAAGPQAPNPTGNSLFADEPKPDRAPAGGTSGGDSTPETQADVQPTIVDLKRRSPAEIEISAALSKTTRMDFLDEPLSDAVTYISQLHGIQIIIDQHAIEEEGMTTDTPIAFRVSGIPLRNALNLMLRPLELEHVVHDQVLLITTGEVAKEILDTRLYPFKSNWPIQPDDMVEYIASCVAPQSWAERGGEGFIARYPNGLIIRQTAKVHDEIAELIRQFSRIETAED